MTQYPKSPSNPHAQQADAGEGSGSGSGSGSQSDLAQTYQHLARGEQTAAALEAHLLKLESKLDALLADLDSLEEVQEDKAGTKGKASNAEGHKNSPGLDKESQSKDA